MVQASGPVWVIDTSVGLITMPVRRDLDWAWRFWRSAAPLHGVPSWKSTLGRRVMVQAV